MLLRNSYACIEQFTGVQMKTPPDLRQGALIPAVNGNWGIRQCGYPQSFCHNSHREGNWHPSVQRNPIDRPVFSRTKNRNSRQVLCRELTLFADRGSERPVSRSRTRDRVDFIPKGSPETRSASENRFDSRESFGMATEVARHRPQVLRWYPPYSRLTQGRTHKMWVGKRNAELCLKEMQ